MRRHLVSFGMSSWPRQTAKAGSRKAQAEQAAKAARQEAKLEAAWQAPGLNAFNLL